MDVTVSDNHFMSNETQKRDLHNAHIFLVFIINAYSRPYKYPKGHIIIPHIFNLHNLVLCFFAFFMCIYLYH